MTDWYNRTILSDHRKKTMEPIVRWPNGYRAAVTLAFDVDGPTGDAMPDNARLQRLLIDSVGRYGPHRSVRGMP